MIYIFLGISTYYLYHFTEYMIHRISHIQHPLNILYLNHKRHHIEHYSYKKPLDFAPFKCDSFLYIPQSILVNGPIILFLYYLIYLFINDYYKFIVTEINILLFISDYIHTQIHIKDSPLEKYQFFKRCRKVHLLHHKNFTKNFSFSGYDNTFDIIFNTYN